MLKRIVFSLQETTYQNETLKSKVAETVRYLEECGYDTAFSVAGDSYFDNLSEKDKKEILVVSDEAKGASDLRGRGFYCVGLLHEGNPGEKFEGLKYVFSEIEEVDIDSFVKVYQRYAGEPWEVIRTDRLLIRETTVSDVDEFYKIYSDPEMTRFMEGLFDDPEDEKRYQKDYIDKVYGLMGFGVWTILRTSDGAIIGRAGFSVRNGFDDIELGFLIGTEYQHQGYAYEACKAILDYGRDILQLEKVQALVKKENLVSIHLCEKLGFTEVDTVTVEENIYGHSYTGNGDTDRVCLSQAHYGDYVRFEIKL